MLDQRRPAAVCGLAARAAVRPRRSDGRPARAWPSRRDPTTCARACATSCERILRFRAGTFSAPTRTSRPTRPCCRSRRSWPRSDLLVIAAPHAEYRTMTLTPPVIDIWGLPRRGDDRMSARGQASRSSCPLTARAGRSSPSGAHRRGGDAAVRGALRGRHRRRSDRRGPRGAGAQRPAVPRPCQRVRPRPGNAIRYGVDHAAATAIVVTMADGSDDPTPDRRSRAARRAWRRRCMRVAVHVRWPAGRRPGLQELSSKTAGRSLHLLARVGTSDATNSFKAYSTDFVRMVGIESRAGFAMGIELTAKARG